MPVSQKHHGESDYSRIPECRFTASFRNSSRSRPSQCFTGALSTNPVRSKSASLRQCPRSHARKACFKRLPSLNRRVTLSSAVRQVSAELSNPCVSLGAPVLHVTLSSSTPTVLHDSTRPDNSTLINSTKQESSKKHNQKSGIAYNVQNGTLFKRPYIIY